MDDEICFSKEEEEILKSVKELGSAEKLLIILELLQDLISRNLIVVKKYRAFQIYLINGAMRHLATQFNPDDIDRYDLDHPTTQITNTNLSRKERNVLKGMILSKSYTNYSVTAVGNIYIFIAGATIRQLANLTLTEIRVLEYLTTDKAIIEFLKNKKKKFPMNKFIVICKLVGGISMPSNLLTKQTKKAAEALK
ncbi:MAG: hypothetical protein ABIG20_03840 [archaeon]